jgi:dTDP-4-amino-4,6-dideoxygalactose transaminase
MANRTMTREKRETIAFSIPSIGKEEIEEVSNTLRSGWITTGPRTKIFENNFAKYVSSQYAIAVNSCTAGLHLALVASNIKRGDEVITTPYTFAATAAVILHCGADVVFADIKKNGFNIDPGRIVKAISKKTKAIIPVHFAGEPCEMDSIMDIAKAHNLVVIEDAAHALGAKYKERMIGTIGTLAAFSFYATKNLTTGEGGMVTTNDAELAEKIRLLSLHGLSRDSWNRYSREGNWFYEILYPGFKYNMSDIQAALGLIQLWRFDLLQQKRRRIVATYFHYLSDIDEIELPPNPIKHQHAWHLFVLRLKQSKLAINRDEFISQLNRCGIGTSVHFIPLHLHPYYRNTFHYQNGSFPNAEATYSSSISLPLYPKLSEQQIHYICKIIKKIIHRYRK